MKNKTTKPSMGLYGRQFVDPDDWVDDEGPRDGRNNNKDKGARRPGIPGGHPNSPTKGGGRTRPTNNQLLYKAYFRWAHYPFKLRNGGSLPSETDACASVTAAFLQVLQTLHTAEQLRTGAQKRSVLQILSTNTRRTKVVELSSGTHRVPDELKKHYLSDGEGGQYSTNLDRNRYGNDDNYLFTVIRYDLEFLGLCPCMVDVEIIDAKANNQSVIVSAGPDACTCHVKQPYAPEVAPAPVKYQEEVPVVSNMRSAPQQQSTRSKESPKPSASGVSQLFDALVMAATGGQEGAAAAGLGGEPPVTSPYLNALPQEGAEAGRPVRPGPQLHSAPLRNRSRLWSAMSFGDMDSLQNALDAFRAEEEIASQPFGMNENQEGSLRQRRRKPPRGNSSFLLRAADSTGGASLGKLGLKEKSDENAKYEANSGGATFGAESGGEEEEGDNEQEQEEQQVDVKPEDREDDMDLPGPGVERRVRHVPRQSSAVNLNNRVASAELSSLRAEVEMLRAENKRLQNIIKEKNRHAPAGDPGQAKRDADRIRQLEQEKKANEEKLTNLTMELAKSRQEVNLLLQKLVSPGAALAGAAAIPGLAAAVALNGNKQGSRSQVDASMAQSLGWFQQPTLIQAAAALDPNIAAHFAALQPGGAAAGKTLANQQAAVAAAIQNSPLGLLVTQQGASNDAAAAVAAAAAAAGNDLSSLLFPTQLAITSAPIMAMGPSVNMLGMSRKASDQSLNGKPGASSGNNSSGNGSGGARPNSAGLASAPTSHGVGSGGGGMKRFTEEGQPRGTEGDQPRKRQAVQPAEMLAAMPADSGLTDMAQMLGAEFASPALEGPSPVGAHDEYEEDE